MVNLVKYPRATFFCLHCGKRTRVNIPVDNLPEEELDLIWEMIIKYRAGGRV
jgi:hypothetical protein